MSKTVFNASDDQLAKIMVNAINASLPAGMGFMHFRPGEISVEDFRKVATGSNFTSVDYFQGRMVKLYAFKRPDGSYQFRGTPDVEYQSWARKYSSYSELLDSAGVSHTIEDDHA